MKTLSLATRGHDSMTDITAEVRQAVRESGIVDGICTVYCPHTTAGITINENADPAVVADILTILDRVVPWQGGYRHAEGNSAAHVKSSMMGCSAQVIIQGGDLVLGTWQSIFFCDFDGPRQRTFHLQVIAS